MQRLWGRWWFRLPVSLIVSPVIMMAGFLVSAFVYEMLTIGKVNSENIFNMPPLAFLYLFIGAETLTVLFVIAMEAGNRQRGRPLPPGICAAFVAIYSLVMALVGSLVSRFALSSLVGTPWLSLLLAFVLPAAVAFGAIQPMIRAWQAKGIKPQDASNLF